MNIVWMNWRCPKHPWAGGAEEHLHQIGKRLIENGHNIRLLTSRGPNKELPSKGNIDGIEVYRYGSTFSVYLHVIKKYVTTHRKWCDVVVDDVNGVPFFAPIYAGRPVVTIIHHLVREIFYDELPTHLALIGDVLERSISSIYRESKVVTVSESSRDELIEFGFDPDGIEVIHNGVNYFEPRGQSNDKNVLYLGRLKAYKRLDHLLKAWRTVINQVPEANLKIAGDGPELPALKKIITQNDIESVHFLGRVSEERKKNLYSESGLFVNPTSKEGFGLTVLEANHGGAPVIAYDVPGVNETVRDGYNGILVQEETPEALAEAMTGLLNDSEECQKLGENAKKHAKKFTWDESAKKFEHTLKRATSP